MLNFLFSNIVFGLSIERKEEDNDLVECPNCKSKFEFETIEEEDFICPVCKEELEEDDDELDIDEELAELYQAIGEMKEYIETLEKQIEEMKKRIKSLENL